MTGRPAVVPTTWWADQPRRLERELAAMSAVAPDMAWDTDDSGWAGTVPLWPFDRPQPARVQALVREPLAVRIVCGPAYPMVEPAVTPLGLDIPLQALGWTRWHVLPNGDLCLLQSTSAWPPEAVAADLVHKVSGWYVEYHLMLAGLIEAMSPAGIAADTLYDDLLDAEPPTP